MTQKWGFLVDFNNILGKIVYNKKRCLHKRDGAVYILYHDVELFLKKYWQEVSNANSKL